MGHLYHGYVSHNQRVNDQATSWEGLLMDDFPWLAMNIYVFCRFCGFC
jgi:hypothetical protein